MLDESALELGEDLLHLGYLHLEGGYLLTQSLVLSQEPLRGGRLYLPVVVDGLFLTVKFLNIIVPQRRFLLRFVNVLETATPRGGVEGHGLGDQALRVLLAFDLETQLLYSGLLGGQGHRLLVYSGEGKVPPWGRGQGRVALAPRLGFDRCGVRIPRSKLLLKPIPGILCTLGQLFKGWQAPRLPRFLV